MGVYLGLIGVVSSGDELASVIAHETSHITQRHIARMLSQQGKQTPLMLASMLLGHWLPHVAPMRPWPS